MVQDSNCGQMRVSGFSSHYEFVLEAGAKAKTVTNNLPLLSVLALRANYHQFCLVIHISSNLSDTPPKD